MEHAVKQGQVQVGYRDTTIYQGPVWYDIPSCNVWEVSGASESSKCCATGRGRGSTDEWGHIFMCIYIYIYMYSNILLYINVY